MEAVERTVTVLARVEPALKAELERRAADHDRSLSAEMRVLLRAGLRRPRPDDVDTEENETWA